MTGNEMLSLLGVRLEDETETDFTETLKLNELNSAQREVAEMVDESYLDDLETEVTGVTLTSGSVDYTTAFSTTLPLGDRVKEVYCDSAAYATRIDLRDVPKLSNTFRTPSASHPKFYLHAKNINVLPNTISSVDIKYIKAPSDISANDNEVSINTSLHDAVMRAAEAKIWGIDNRLNRQNAARNEMVSIINALNARAQSEDAEIEAQTGE